MECNTMSCFSEAVAKSVESGRVHCIECAVKIAKHFGPDSLETIPGKKFPWDYPGNMVCPHCGIRYNKYLINLTGDCPSCKKSLPEYTDTWAKKKVVYKEGPHD